MNLAFVGSLKRIPGRMVAWAFFVSLLASQQFITLVQNRPPAPTFNAIPEIGGFAPLEHSPAPKQAPEPGMKIASKEVDKVSPNAIVMMEESLVSFVYHTSAKQKAVLEKSNEMMEQMKKQIESQKAAIDGLTTKLDMLDKQLDFEKIKTKELEAKFNEKQTAEKLNLKKMVKLYGAMPNDKVTKIVENMEDDAVVALFTGMKDADVGRIMAEMPSKRAAKLTLKMTDLKGAR